MLIISLKGPSHPDPSHCAIIAELALFDSPAHSADPHDAADISPRTSPTHKKKMKAINANGQNPFHRWIIAGSKKSGRNVPERNGRNFYQIPTNTKSVQEAQNAKFPKSQTLGYFAVTIFTPSLLT